MPNIDKTGPVGSGSKTGRGLGLCNGQISRSFGCKRGLGHFFGWNQPQTKEEKNKALSNYRKALEEELEDTKKIQADLK